MRFSVAAALVAVVVLAGCAAEPTPTPDAGPIEPPARVFDGDCTALFADAALSDALGRTLAGSSVTDGVYPARALVEQHGGLRCGWGTADFSTVVYVIAVPAGVVTIPEDESCGTIGSGASTCTIDATSNGIRVSGIVATTAADTPALLKDVAAVEALFATTATAERAVPAPIQSDAAWATPADCSGVLNDVDFAAEFRVTDSFSWLDAPDTGAYFPPVERALWGGHASPTCSIASDNPDAFYGIDFSVLGGGIWTKDAVASQTGTTLVTVDGFDTVYETPSEGFTTIDVFDGVNWFETFAAEPAAMYPMIRKIVASLNAR